VRAFFVLFHPSIHPSLLTVHVFASPPSPSLSPHRTPPSPPHRTFTNPLSPLQAYDPSATAIPGGWLDHHYIQLAYQLADSVGSLSYSFAMTVRTFRALFARASVA
jgi:hypothetical protein